MSWSPTRLKPTDVLPLLQVPVSELSTRALVMGDPARVERAAALLDEARVLGRNREYLTVGGTWRGVPVTIASHGVGSAGAGVCIEELLRGGVRRIIRCGTAGGLRSDVVDGDLVVATGAIRDDGLTERLVPASFPALSDASLQSALVAAGRARSARVHSGVVLTCDLFYPGPEGSPLARWASAGAIAVEMELSVVLVLAALHGAQAAGIFAIDGNPLSSGDEAEMSGYDPHREVVVQAADDCLSAGLDAVTAD